MKSFKRVVLLLSIIISLILLILLLIVLRNLFLEKGILSLKEEQYDVAVKYLKPMAFIGDSEAQRLIGECYAFGFSVPRNPEKAMYWFRKAAERSNCTDDQCIAADLYFVGETYLEGVGVGIDREEAVYWIKLAAKNGHPKAINYLSNNNN
jgi:hypothetical protein